MSEFRMPKLGADMDLGKLVAWRKQPGDLVGKGEIIADVETDKAQVEVEAFQAGVLERILVQPGERVPVGTVLAILRAAGEPAPTFPVAGPPAPTPVEEPPASRVAISPAAKRRAHELGLDITALQGSGPGGRIQLEDVEALKGPAPPVPEADPRMRMRRAIAAAPSSRPWTAFCKHRSSYEPYRDPS